MEISAIEIGILCHRISEAVPDYFLSGIYSMERGALLRLNHESKAEKLVAVSAFASWITTKNLSLPEATKFISRLRTEIERARLTSVEQIGNERIARFSFEGRKKERRDLYAEFFSHGNLILTDPSIGNAILDVEHPQTFRHRNLLVGEKYSLPPTRGIGLQDVDYEVLASNFRGRTAEDKNLSSIKWFGRNIGTSRKFVEEIFHRAIVNPELPVDLLDDAMLKQLASACLSLRQDLEHSQAGYIFLPSEESNLDVDVCPIIPQSWRVLVEKGFAIIQSFPSLGEALDQVQIEALVLERKRKSSTKARAKSEELSSAIAKQSEEVERNLAVASELRQIALQLMNAERLGAEEALQILEKLRSFEIVESAQDSPSEPRFATEPRSFYKSYTSAALSSRLFDEAKRLDAETRKLREVMGDLESQKANLMEQTRSLEERAERTLVTNRRARQWFERYRWFVTSDGRLAVGGRDSTSNSIVINKYTQNEDIVFHADLHGSPFFILKNSGQSHREPDENIAIEVSQATVSFSRAWKDELGSADAFWVYPEQVKKGAPSGEYLPRGSFFIEGKKNFVRHVKVQLSVGLTFASRLQVRDAEDEKASSELGRDEETSESEAVVVVCGPEKSIAKYCFVQVNIAPGKEKASDFARKLKQLLVSKVKDEASRESSKKLQVDEVMRVLPSGAYKVVSERQNR